jgi:hypothetical protein
MSATVRPTTWYLIPCLPNLLKKKTKIKLDGGQLLLTVTDKRQTRPLVREGAQQRQDTKINAELISGCKSQSGLNAKKY